MAVNRLIEEGFVSPGILRERAERQAQIKRMAAKPKEAFTLVLEGLEVPVLSGRIVRSIDTVADGWSAEISWTPGKDRQLDHRVAPYAYPKAQVYLGSTLVNTGRLYTVQNGLGGQGLTKQLEGWSYTVDLVDSTIGEEGGYEWASISVWELCLALLKPLGLQVKTNLGDIVVPTMTGPIRVAKRFDWIQADPTQTYADFITKCAFQRGMLVTNDEEGNLFLTAANVKSAPVATLQEGQPPVQAWEAKFDGRKRFYSYAVSGTSGDGVPLEAVEYDRVVPTTRRTAVTVGDTDLGGIGMVAAWKRSQQLAEALSISLPVTGWYTPQGELWKPNTLVHVVAPSIHVEKGFTFLIREVECVQAAAGQTATLHLLPPHVYTGGKIEEPWA